MRCRVPGRKQTTAEKDERVLVWFQRDAVRGAVRAKKQNIDLAAMREQSDAVRANRGDDSLNLHELRVQAAVDQLVPGGLHRQRQFSRSQPGDPNGVQVRRELTGISDSLNLQQLSHLRRLAERRSEAVNVNSPRGVLD